MFKTLILSLILLPTFVSAEVSMRWLGVASIALTDGKSTILFDPMYTRAGIGNWLGLFDLRSDEKVVEDILGKQKILKIDGIFASHSHYDHVIDAPIVSKLYKAPFYVDPNSERIAKAYKDSSIKTIPFKNQDKIKIGDFTIQPIIRGHSKIKALGGFEFQSGPVPTDFDFGFWEYRVGDTWMYYIEHVDGTLLIDQGSNPYLDKIIPITDAVDALVQGVANRENDNSIIEGYNKALGPKVFVPLHFDNFILSKPGEESRLPGVKVEEILDKLRKAYPERRVVLPEFGKKLILLKRD